MTRTERITKLSNAIKEYRGSYVPGSEPKKWIRNPKPSANARVLVWLDRLHVKDKIAAMEKIDAFANVTEMRAWLDTLETFEGHPKCRST